MISIIDLLRDCSISCFKEFSLFLIIMPIIASIICFLLRSNSQKRSVLFIAGFFHFLVSALLVFPQLYIDNISISNSNSLFISSFSGNVENAVFLMIVSLLFLGASYYVMGYLPMEEKNIRKDEEGFIINDEPETVFSGFMLLFLASMTLVCFSNHMGLLWAAIEATTLFSAPLIYFHRSRKSLEATWKYLVVCSVGIAIALLGTFFLSIAASSSGGSLYISDLYSTNSFNTLWLKLAFIFLFVGYGTKMGLSPMHTWLPDAHSEAPSMVSALLSGALLNCAFLAIWKSHLIVSSAGLESFSSSIMVVFGIFTLFISAVFIINQREYKRALAYSSVENMGLMCLLLGISSIAGYENTKQFIFINAIGHSLIKSGMFFLAGLVFFQYKSKKFSDIESMVEKTPTMSAVWFIGFILLSGAPPSPLFLPKFFLIKAFLSSGNYYTAIFIILAFIIIFGGLGRIFFSTLFGSKETEKDESPQLKKLLIPSQIFFLSSMFVSFLFLWFLRG